MVRRWSGRPDLNRGPSAPKADALPGLRYAPIGMRKGGGRGRTGKLPRGPRLRNGFLQLPAGQFCSGKCRFSASRNVRTSGRASVDRRPHRLMGMPQTRVGKAHQLRRGHAERARHAQRDEAVPEPGPGHLGHRLEGFHGVFDTDVHAPLAFAQVDLGAR